MKTAWGLLGVLLLCFMVLLTGCKKNIESSSSMSEWLQEHDAAEELSWQACAREGDTYSKQNNLEQAYLQYSKALNLNPDDLDLRVKRGNILFRKQLMEKALTEYTAVLEKSEERLDANLGAGKVYFAVNDLDNAMQYLDKARSGGCEFWEANAILGIIQDYKGKTLEGEKFFQEALTCQPHNGDVLNNLGANYLMQGKFSQAIDVLLEAIKAGNTKKRVYNNLGVALVKSKRYQEAFEAFKMSSSEAVAYNNIGYIYYLQREYKKAVKCFEKALLLHSAYYAEADENLKRAKAALFSAQVEEEQLEFVGENSFSTDFNSDGIFEED